MVGQMQGIYHYLFRTFPDFVGSKSFFLIEFSNFLLNDFGKTSGTTISQLSCISLKSKIPRQHRERVPKMDSKQCDFGVLLTLKTEPEH